MAGEEGSQPNKEQDQNSEHVIVTSKKGEDPASSPKENGKNIYDIIANIYLAPFLTLVEIHLWKTRTHHHKEKHECLHEFKMTQPRLYFWMVVADVACLVIFILALLFVVLAIGYAVLQGGIKLSDLG